MKLKSILFLVSCTVLGSNSYAQTVPTIKSSRTEVHRAEQKGTEWIPGAIVSHIHFIRFDSKGRKLAENSLNPNGSANFKIIYLYDDEGRVKEEIAASVKEGGITNIYQYSYDAQGRRNGKKQLSPERIEVGGDTIIRNDAGLVSQKAISGRLTNPVNKLIIDYQSTIEIIYNEAGKPVKVVEKSSINKNAKDRERDLQPNDTMPLKLHSEAAFNQFRAPEKKKTDFVYDKYANWVKRTEYNGATPEFIVTRDIEYAGRETDREQLLLKGNVKSVRQTSYIAVAKGPETIDKGQKKGVFFTHTFDKEGRKTTTEHFSETGVLKGITEYTYDENGRIRKEILKSPAGKIENTIQWNHDETGTLRNKVQANAQGEMLHKAIFRYDLEGNCINETWYNPDASKYSEFRYKYDPYGNIISREVPIAPSDTKDADYEPVQRMWNTRGRIAEEWFGLPENMRHYTYKYSSRGEVISGTEPSDKQADASYIYKFFNDTQNNWKKRIKFIGDTPVLYEEREYTYYN